MRNLIKWVLIFILICFPLISNAGISIKVYCSGGAQFIPPAVCPKPCNLRTLCAEVNFDSWEDIKGVAREVETSKLYIIILEEPLTEKTLEINGSELKIKHIEPIK